MQLNLPALQPSKLNPKLYWLSNFSVFQLQTMAYHRDGGDNFRKCLSDQQTGFWQNTDKHREPVKDVPKNRFPPEKHPEVPFGRSVDGLRWEGEKTWWFSNPCLSDWIFNDTYMQLTNETHQELESNFFSGTAKNRKTRTSPGRFLRSGTRVEIQTSCDV